MPQRELKFTKGFSIDPITGYMVSLDSRSKITPEVKSKFIAQFLELRDVADACRASGFNRRGLAGHLRADSKFRQDFKRAKERIKEEPLITDRKAVLDRLWTK